MRNDVRVLRESEGLSQGELAGLLRHKVSRQTINAIERGKYNPSIWLALDLAHHFGKPVEEIFHADSHG